MQNFACNMYWYQYTFQTQKVLINTGQGTLINITFDRMNYNHRQPQVYTLALAQTRVACWYTPALKAKLYPTNRELTIISTFCHIRHRLIIHGKTGENKFVSSFEV